MNEKQILFATVENLILSQYTDTKIAKGKEDRIIRDSASSDMLTEGVAVHHDKAASKNATIIKRFWAARYLLSRTSTINARRP